MLKNSHRLPSAGRIELIAPLHAPSVLLGMQHLRVHGLEDMVQQLASKITRLSRTGLYRLETGEKSSVLDFGP